MLRIRDGHADNLQMVLLVAIGSWSVVRGSGWGGIVAQGCNLADKMFETFRTHTLCLSSASPTGWGTPPIQVTRGRRQSRAIPRPSRVRACAPPRPLTSCDSALHGARARRVAARPPPACSENAPRLAVRACATRRTHSAREAHPTPQSNAVATAGGGTGDPRSHRRRLGVLDTPHHGPWQRAARARAAVRRAGEATAGASGPPRQQRRRRGTRPPR